MKLKVTDWKQAWFESHISDRFFQEMSKLEKGSVQGLETTAQWMEQIMIEVGLLAQAMIRLEQAGAPEPQIRLAYDKSMRVAALALHLITALDGTDREQIRSASIVRNDHGERASGRSTPAQPPVPPQRAVPPPAAIAAAPQAAPAAPAAAPAAAGSAPVNPALQPLLNRGSAFRPPLPAPRGERNAPSPRANTPHPTEAGIEGVGADVPLFSSLVQVSGRNAARGESQARQTILSLSQQGLSRAEIEMVTGEPRHVIEAVLNHDRSQKQAGAQPG
jgi:hypothetical protein